MTFPQACENLVHAVAKIIDMKPNLTVLDVGFGCGDSCIVFSEQYNSKVTGITNEWSQWNIANNRVSSNSQLKENVQLLHGSADDLDIIIEPDNKYDRIVSIDSAYHYNTRWSFLKNAFERLKSNGKIGLYDLVLDRDFKKNATPVQYKITTLVCNMARIPVSNLVSLEEYEQNLKDIGYKAVEIQRLERSEVFGGLSKSFNQQYDNVLKYGIGISISNRVLLKLSAFLFGLLGTKAWIVPVLVKGEKQSE